MTFGFYNNKLGNQTEELKPTADEAIDATQQSPVVAPTTQAASQETTQKADPYNNDVLTPLFKKIESPKGPEYNEKLQATNKRTAKLNGLGNALLTLSDGVTLGMGGRVQKRKPLDVDKYLDRYSDYDEKYNKASEDYDTQQYLEELRQAGAIQDQSNTDRTFGATQDQRDIVNGMNESKQDFLEGQTGNNNEYRDTKFDADEKYRYAALAQRDKDRNATQSRWKAEFDREGGDETRPFEYTDYKGNERSIADMRPEQYDKYHTNAMKDKAFWDSKEIEGMTVRTPTGEVAYNSVTKKEEPIYETSLRKNVTDDDIVRSYLTYKTHQSPLFSKYDDDEPEEYTGYKPPTQVQMTPKTATFLNQKATVAKSGGNAGRVAKKDMLTHLMQQGFGKDEAIRMVQSSIK